VFFVAFVWDENLGVMTLRLYDDFMKKRDGGGMKNANGAAPKYWF